MMQSIAHSGDRCHPKGADGAGSASLSSPITLTTPPVYIRYCGPTEDQVDDVILKKFKELVPRCELVGGSWDKAWNVGKRKLRFKNGSEVKFLTYKQWETSPGVFGGKDLDAVYQDEHAREEIWRENMMRLVDRNGYFVSTMTPEMGMTWEEDHVQAAVGVEYWFFSTERNPYLSQLGVAAIKETMDGLDPRIAEAKLHGRFVPLSGLVIPMWDRGRHIRADFEIPGHWPRVFAIDPHRRKPTAMVWAAWSPEGELFVYRTAKEKMTVDQLKEFIRTKSSGENVVRWICDEAMGGKGTDIVGKESVLQMLRKAPNGIPVVGTNQSSDKRFEAGVFKLWEYLKPDVKGRCRFYVFESCNYGIEGHIDGFPCGSLPWEIEHYQYKSLQKQDEENFREKVRRVNDDFVDCCRYIVMSGDPGTAGRTYYEPETGREESDEYTGL